VPASPHGRRLNDKILAVKIAGNSIIDITDLPVTKCMEFFSTIELNEKEQEIAKQVLKEINARLEFLEKVGYVTGGVVLEAHSYLRAVLKSHRLEFEEVVESPEALHVHSGKARISMGGTG